MKDCRLKRMRAPDSWRGMVRKWFGLRPGKIHVVVGIACTGHGASIAVMTSEGVLRSSVLDRWAGIKHLLMFARKEDLDIRYPKFELNREINFVLKYAFGKFPATFIFEDTVGEWLRWLLRDMHLSAEDVDLVVTSESHFATCRWRLGWRLHKWFPNAWIADGIEHHEIHQRQAYWQSGFEKAAVLTLDSCGERLARLGGRSLAGTIGVMDASGHYENRSNLFFPGSSPGLLYDVVTRHVGFRMGDEGKTMGLAPYGEAELFRRIEPLLHLDSDGTFEFIPHQEFQAHLERYVPERLPGEEMSPRHRNVAYAGQAMLERIVQNAFAAARRLTGEQRLAYAGGVALNSVANEGALRAVDWDAAYIAPNPGDTGHALGCALFGAYEIAGWPPPLKEVPEFIGPAYPDSELIEAARGSGFPLNESGNAEADLACCIANGYITARFAGGAEYGPRALGNRSILCDPRRPDMKDHLNSRVKHREGFRPFAPAVLEDRADAWFDIKNRSPFMLRVVPVREGVRSRIPAVVHVDGSCRVQTVANHENPRFYRVIREFEDLTGVPVILNTSFNVAGKPIVETPQNALECFRSTEIDVLALGSVLVSKLPLSAYRTPRPVNV
jgi:carbamoyltransferase